MNRLGQVYVYSDGKENEKSVDTDQMVKEAFITLSWSFLTFVWPSEMFDYSKTLNFVWSIYARDHFGLGRLPAWPKVSVNAFRSWYILHSLYSK